MRNIGYIFILCLLASCVKQETTIEWVNQQDSLNYDTFVFELKTMPENIIQDVYVYSGVQARELKILKKKDRVVAHIPKETDFFTGPARLVIVDKNESATTYSFVGLQSSERESKDFRSPKTLITDSSLTQQQLVYTISKSRNLVMIKNAPGLETWKELSPKEKTYQAQEAKVETSYYVEAGSAEKILLGKMKSNSGKGISFVTGILLDKYGNQVANGTRAIFNIEKGTEQIRIERVIDNAIAQLTMPDHIQPPYSVYVSIGVVTSNKLDIQ